MRESLTKPAGVDSLDRIRVVLVGTSHPGNIGSAARAMLTMGLRRLVLVAPRRFPDPEADALASGASSVLAGAHVVDTLDEALADAALTVGLSARPRAFAGQVLPVREAARRAIGEAVRSDVALVFGGEMSGLSNDELARCSIVATIPSNPRYTSLNLAAAVQVAAYELFVAANGGDVWRAPRFAAATHDEVEALHDACRTDADGAQLPRSPHAASPAASVASVVRTRGPRARGSEYPAWHSRAHRPASRRESRFANRSAQRRANR